MPATVTITEKLLEIKEHWLFALDSTSMSGLLTLEIGLLLFFCRRTIGVNYDVFLKLVRDFF